MRKNVYCCMKKVVCWMLALLTVLSLIPVFTACSEPSEDPIDATSKTTGSSETMTEEVDDRFEGINYDGRAFRIHTSSAPSWTTTSSNYLIEGSGQIGGGMVSDAVFERNIAVEETLGVTLEFTPADISYTQVYGEIRKLVSAGTDDYDLFINDIMGFADLAIEGSFLNVMDEDCVFDFDRSYWYKDYMEDIRFLDGYQFFLAGDFFIDILRTAHLMLLNKQLYTDYYHSPADELYDVVLNYEWTYEKMLTLTSDLYVDKDLDGQRSGQDQYGYVDWNHWGATIPLAASGTTNFIEREEDGCPVITINQGDRANQLASYISALFHSESTGLLENETDINFAAGNSLLTGAFSLGSLENELLRQMEGDVAVLPYPMLFASDKKYTTATHQTTEMGAILVTASDLTFISTVVEVLNRETAKILIPQYYKEGLQVQLVDDAKSAAMIDIIHDNFDNSFILAQDTALGDCILRSFMEAAVSKREYSAVYAGMERSVNRTLERKISLFQKKNGIE